MTEFFVDDERSLVRAPHQGEASWTAVVLYRFWVARTVPASRVAGKGDLTTDFTEDHGLRCRGSSPGRFALPFPVPSAVGRSVSLSRGPPEVQIPDRSPGRFARMAVRFVPPFQIFNRRGAWRSDTFSKQANGSNGSKNSVLHPIWGGRYPIDFLVWLR